MAKNREGKVTTKDLKKLFSEIAQKKPKPPNVYILRQLDSGALIQQEYPRYRGTESWDYKRKEK